MLLSKSVGTSLGSIVSEGQVVAVGSLAEVVVARVRGVKTGACGGRVGGDISVCRLQLELGSPYVFSELAMGIVDEVLCM